MKLIAMITIGMLVLLTLSTTLISSSVGIVSASAIDDVWVYPDTTIMCDGQYFGAYPKLSAAEALTPHFGYNYFVPETKMDIYDGLPTSDWPADVETLSEAYTSHPELVNNEMYSSDSLYFMNISNTAGTEEYGTFYYICTLDIPEDLPESYYTIAFYAEANFAEYRGDTDALDPLLITTESSAFTTRIGIGAKYGVYDYVYNWTSIDTPGQLGSYKNLSKSSSAEIENVQGSFEVYGDGISPLWWYGSYEDQWNASSDTPYYYTDLSTVRMAIEFTVTSSIWSKVNMGTYDGGKLRVYLASMGALLQAVDYEGPGTPTPATNIEQTTEIMNYLIAFMALSSMSFASSFSLKNMSFSFEVFLVAFGIGTGVLVWCNVVPNYLLLIPALIIGGLVLSKTGASD
jgi:hypothetical protein